MNQVGRLQAVTQLWCFCYEGLPSRRTLTKNNVDVATLNLEVGYTAHCNPAAAHAWTLPEAPHSTSHSAMAVPKNDFFLEVIFEFVDESLNTSSMRSMLRTVKCLWRHILCSTWLAAGCSKALTAGYLRVTLCCNDVHHGQWLSTCQSLWCFGTSAAIWLEIDSSNVLKNLSSRM